MDTKRLLSGARDTGLQVLQRTRDFGWRSGATLLSTRARNLRLKVQDRIGPSEVACPCCGWTGSDFRVLDCGNFLVPNVECPNCKGHERHRFIHVLLERRPPSFMREGAKVLHFAAEEHIRKFLRRVPNIFRIETDYAAYMLYNTEVPRIRTDIHFLPLPDNSLDGVFCLHVLEHVADDRAAIRELHRVLRPGGEAIIMVPFMMHQTETEEYGKPDPMIFDHMRGYSPRDFKYRLEPFDYEELYPANVLTQDEVKRYKVPDSQVLYVCRKR